MPAIPPPPPHRVQQKHGFSAVQARFPASASIRTVRLTLPSMTGQVDAVRQIPGVPLISLAASLLSVPAAITTSGLLLTPALPLIRAADRKEPSGERKRRSLPLASQPHQLWGNHNYSYIPMRN